MTSEKQPEKLSPNLSKFRPKRLRRKSRVLSQIEIETMLATPINNRERIFINLLVYTGLRISDIVTIRVENVDVKLKLIRLKQIKTEKDVLIPLSDRFLADLKVYLNENLKGKAKGWIFPSPKIYKRAISIRTGEHMLTRMIKRTPLKDITPHDFRATLMTRAGAEGIDNSLMSQSTGTTSKTMDEHYKKFTPEQFRHEWKKLWESYGDK